MQIKSKNKLITTGNKVNNLYYLPVAVLTRNQAFYSNVKNSNIRSIEYIKNNANINTSNNISNYNLNNHQNKDRTSSNEVITKDIQTVTNEPKATNSGKTQYNSLKTSYKNPEKHILWHKRMAHPNSTILNKLSENTTNYNKDYNIDHNLHNCEICIQAKLTNHINHKTNNSTKPTRYLQKVASDICGPIIPATYNKKRYFITFLDKYTRYLEIALLTTKNEAYTCFCEYKQRAENNPKNYKITTFASDNGGEYINKHFKALFKECGITHQISPPYTKEPNGFAERINRTLFDKIRAILLEANLPLYLWGEALLAVVYIYNRTPHSAISYKTPYEMKNNTKPDISNIKIWGSVVYYKDKTNNNNSKLKPKAKRGILIGYGQNQYRIWDIDNKRPIWSRDVHIIEGRYINITNKKDNPDQLQTEYISVLQPDILSEEEEIQNQLYREINGRNTSNIEIELENNIQTENNAISGIEPNTDIEVNNNNEYYDTSEDELALILISVNINNEPNIYKQAQKQEYNNKLKWNTAMYKELKELENQNTYSIIDIPDKNINILKGRWVYKIKADGSYKARWVVKGFNQILGVNYTDTFSTTCRPEIYRTIFTIALLNGWKLK